MKAVKIDPQNPPKGATHHSSYTFYKITDGGIWAWIYGGIGISGGRWVEQERIKGLGLAPLPTKEIIWGGSDLPPVGVTCERLWNSSDSSYMKVFIHAHHDAQAVYEYLEGDRRGEILKEPNVHWAGAYTFRPIKTQAEINADARSDAIDKLADEIAEYHGLTGARVTHQELAMHLYALNYRRFEILDKPA